MSGRYLIETYIKAVEVSAETKLIGLGTSGSNVSNIWICNSFEGRLR
jgi:hypothetical protein